MYILIEHLSRSGVSSDTRLPRAIWESRVELIGHPFRADFNDFDEDDDCALESPACAPILVFAPSAVDSSFFHQSMSNKSACSSFIKLA